MQRLNAKPCSLRSGVPPTKNTPEAPTSVQIRPHASGKGSALLSEPNDSIDVVKNRTHSASSPSRKYSTPSSRRSHHEKNNENNNTSNSPFAAAGKRSPSRRQHGRSHGNGNTIVPSPNRTTRINDEGVSGKVPTQGVLLSPPSSPRRQKNNRRPTNPLFAGQSNYANKRTKRQAFASISGSPRVNLSASYPQRKPSNDVQLDVGTFTLDDIVQGAFVYDILFDCMFHFSCVAHIVLVLVSINLTAEELLPDINSIIIDNALELSMDSVCGKPSLCNETGVKLPSQPRLDCTSQLSVIEQRANQMLDAFSAHNHHFRGGILDLVTDYESGTSNSPSRQYFGKSLVELCNNLYTALTNLRSLDTIDLVGKFNRERMEDFEFMKSILPKEKHHMINLAHCYVSTMVALGYLHYSPDGTLQIDGHCMSYDQCCIRLILQSLPRAVFHSYFKMKSTKTYENEIRVNDLAALTAKKSDKDSDMTDQVSVQVMMY